MEMYQNATSIFIHKQVKYEDLQSFSSISPLYLMPIAISITTTITTDITDATTITTTSSTNTNLPMGMLYWWYRDLIFTMTALNRELIHEMDVASKSVSIRYIWPPLTYVIFQIEHHQTLTVDMEDFSNLSFILEEKFRHLFGYIWIGRSVWNT